MRILLLSRYNRLGASSRLRSFQYLPFLGKYGFYIEQAPLFPNGYLKALYGNERRTKLIVLGYLHRMSALFWARHYDLIWIEKELFPYMPALMEWLLKKIGVPYVVDYDDALFHRYDCHRRWLIRSMLGKKIDTVMRLSTCVIAGNDYLAQRARDAGAQTVAIVPTVVDIDRYGIQEKSEQKRRLTVGWIGSPSTSKYLTQIAPVLQYVAKKIPVRFIAVGADIEQLAGLPIEVRPWSEESEVASIHSFDIGIMPLVDDPWERGKCGYKLIQYMACGKPVVASPVGVNRQIVEHGKNGFLASTQKEWIQSLLALQADLTLRRSMGKHGYQKVERQFSLHVTAPRLAEILSRSSRQSVADSMVNE